MKKIILDTSFIVSCARNKLDFFEELPFMGFQIVIPDQVIAEIKRLVNSNKKLKHRDDAELALKLLEINKFETLDLKENYVDKGIINFASKNKSVAVATLDKELKQKLSNSLVVIRGKKKLEII